MKKVISAIIIVLSLIPALSFGSQRSICVGVCDSDSLSDAEWEKMNEECTKTMNEQLISDTIVGDFNGDGIKEKVWYECPKVLSWDTQECDGPIETRICCSDPSIETFVNDMTIGGRLHFLGDLNEDGCDELGYYDGWFLSNLHGYHILGLKGGKKWKELAKSFTHLGYLG